MVVSRLRNAMAIGACCAAGSSSCSSAAFTPPTSSSSSHNKNLRAQTTSSTLLKQGGRPMDDPFAPSPRRQNGGGGGDRRSPGFAGFRGDSAADGSPSIDITDRQSNLSYNRQSVNEDPRAFDYERRFSQRPTSTSTSGMPDDPSMQPRRAWWESSPNTNGRIQGGSRHTWDAPMDRDSSHVFLESDGRPIDTEIELWDGPNNTPTKLHVYSEDGRMRPINLLSENPQFGRSNTMSVRNTGPMEFPINAGISSVGRSSSEGSITGMGARPMMNPSGVRPMGLAGSEGAHLTEHELNGFTRPSSPSMARGETVQGGALRTFPLDYSVEAVQVTITTEGLPMNAKVELWGTSSHIKQLAEIYNDDGQRRPFASIIDVPGGSNTIAVYNTGPMEYPIKVVVEPVARMEGWDGREDPGLGGHLAPW